MALLSMACPPSATFLSLTLLTLESSSQLRSVKSDGQLIPVHHSCLHLALQHFSFLARSFRVKKGFLTRDVHNVKGEQLAW